MRRSRPLSARSGPPDVRRCEPPPPIRIAVLVVSCLLLAAAPAASIACSACQCGDPTLLLMGSGLPRPGLWRFSAGGRTGRTLTGRSGIDEQREVDTRAFLGVSTAPSDRLFLSATFPIVRRRLEAINHGRVTATAPGDVELRARVYGLRRGDAAAGLLVGVTFPTAPRQYGDDGDPLDIDVQSGLGAWQGALGAWGSRHLGPWHVHLSSVVQSATMGWENHRPGRAWLSTASVRRRLSRTVVAQGSLDLRSAGHDTYDGHPDETSGGFAGFVSPSLSLSPAANLVIDAGAQIPVRPPDPPHHRERAVFTLALSWIR